MTIIMSISPLKNSANTTAKWTSKQDLIRMRRHSDLYSRGVHSKTPLGHPYIYEQGDSNFELGGR